MPLLRTVLRNTHCSRLVTLFLYMVAELSALQQIINALTGLDGLPVVIVEALVTTIYTCMFPYTLFGSDDSCT